MQTAIELMEPLRRIGGRLGPYVLLELLLPGGTVLALLLFLHQRLKAEPVGLASLPASPPALVSAVYEASAHAPSPRAPAAFV
jgi:hypothetical protein